MERRFVGVGCGRRGSGDVEVEEVECRWVVYEGTEDQGDGEWAVCRRWEGCWRTRHVLHGKSEREVKGVFDRGASETTYELKFGFAARGDANGLDAFFARDGVVEAEEGLVGLDALALVGFGELEGEFEGVGGAEGQWLWLLSEGESVWVEVSMCFSGWKG